jgi:choline kinase
VRVIVLAAGQGYQLDGLNKCLIKDPTDGRSILEKVVLAFPGFDVTVVVGYRAVAIMQAHPRLNYVYNKDWAVTNNSYSLALALTSDDPCYVLSSDLVFEPALIRAMQSGPDNAVLSECRENRVLSAVNCTVEGTRITELYQGPLRKVTDPEAIGIYKISDARLVRAWRQNCLQHGNLFVGQNLPVHGDYPAVEAFDLGQHRFREINTPLDYLRLLSDLQHEEDDTRTHSLHHRWA